MIDYYERMYWACIGDVNKLGIVPKGSMEIEIERELVRESRMAKREEKKKRLKKL